MKKLLLIMLTIVFLISCMACSNNYPASNDVTVMPPDTPNEAPDNAPTILPDDIVEETGNYAGSEQNTQDTINSGASLDSLSLSDPDIYRSINGFLSEFSEVDLGFYSKDSVEIHNASLISFAINHIQFHNHELCEKGSYSNGCNMRIAKSEIIPILSNFFGTDIQVDVSDENVIYSQDDAYFYWEETEEDISNGFSIADTLTDTGDNIYEVTFEIYGAGNYGSSEENEYYSLTPEMAEAAFEAPASATGTAKFLVETKEDGLHYTLLFWETQVLTTE